MAPGITGAKGVLYCSLYVRARAPMVRPWKLAEKQTISLGAVALASYGSIPAARTDTRTHISQCISQKRETPQEERHTRIGFMHGTAC